METHISNFLSIPEVKQSKPLYPRQELIKMFVDRINSDRISAGYNALTARFIATKMYSAGLKDDFDLWWFWGYCNDSKNFSKCWWWSLKAK